MRKKILVIEDDTAILEVVKIILEDNNFSVDLISTPDNIVEKVIASSPTLILLDIWISGFDGRDIVKALAAHKETKDIPIVLVSANNEVEKIAKEVGVSGVLKKPFNISDLITIVHTYAKAA